MLACDSTWTCPPSIEPLAIVIRSPSLQSCATCDVAIRKLWLPTRVTPSSFSVARLIVTPSRMMLWSPISTRVGVPW